MAVIVLPMDGGYKPRGNLAFEPYQVRQKRLGLPDVRNKGPLSLIPEGENAAHKARMAAYWKAIHAEEEAKKVHTCADWDFSSSDEDSPSEWCPACRHAAWLRHSRASQKALVDAYLADKYPQPVVAKPQPQPLTIKVTVLQKSMIEAGGATGAMMRDSLCKANMRPFWYYAELEDKDWLNRKMPARVSEPGISKERYMAILEQLHGPVKTKPPREQGYVPAAAPAPAAAASAVPAFFARVAAPAAQVAAPAAAAPAPAPVVAALSGDEAKREAAFNAWVKPKRHVRKPYFRGRTIAGNCIAEEHRVILKNLPLEVASLKADMWELVAQVAPVVDLWAPKGIVISLANAADVDTVLNRFAGGLEYYGSIVRFERMGARTK